MMSITHSLARLGFSNAPLPATVTFDLPEDAMRIYQVWTKMLPSFLPDILLSSIQNNKWIFAFRIHFQTMTLLVDGQTMNLPW